MPGYHARDEIRCIKLKEGYIINFKTDRILEPPISQHLKICHNFEISAFLTMFQKTKTGYLGNKHPLPKTEFKKKKKGFSHNLFINNLNDLSSPFFA